MFEETKIPGLFIVDIFSEEECNYLLNKIKRKKWEQIEYTHLKTTILNDVWGYNIFRKLIKNLPSKLNNRNIVGINNIYNFSKYLYNHRDYKHTNDIVLNDENKSESIMSLDICLDNSKGSMVFYWNDLKHCVNLKKGRGLLYYNQIEHENEGLVMDESRYIVNCDLMIQNT